MTYPLRVRPILFLLAFSSQAAEIRAIVTREPATAIIATGGAVFAATAKGALRCAPNASFQPRDLTDREGAYTCTAAAMPPGAAKASLPATAGDGRRNWSLSDVQGSAVDAKGNLWFSAAQGIGRRDAATGKWQLWTTEDGLPSDDFTGALAAGDGYAWFGTHKGAIRFDGKTWEYRQGPRWLAGDEVLGIALTPNGDAWFATNGGISVIERRPVTLAEKARFFEEEIDRRHRRTKFGYVLGVTLARAGDKSEWTNHDSDNDGLWTSMYGAGQCYAYAATGSAKAKERATKALEAMRHLRVVTQGGAHPAPPGFIARTVLPASAGDPNKTHYTPERDRQTRATRDSLWKVMDPRWPLSADGEWYWKSDTSSDELDGHFFFYALYYDLVARTDEEKRMVREQTAAIADHLLAHDYKLVDHDGLPTRWAIFDPENLNHNRTWWQERGMNSLSILAYLRAAHHITGEAKYGAAIRTLVRDHGYGMNAMIPKTSFGPGAGNQSDDEMIFMNFYTLLKYEKDPDLVEKFALAFHNAWLNEEPELNPLFNYLYAAVGTGKRFTESHGTTDLTPQGDWLPASRETLERYPLDRIQWPMANSHRKDIVPLHPRARGGASRAVGARRDGRVLPIDERFVEHWNHDPWQLDYAGAGRGLADGASFLLPYYMGLFYGYVKQ